MLRSLFSRFLKPMFLGRARRSGKARRNRRAFRPELVDLESRTLLSTIVWLRPAGGAWDDPANWAGGRVPNSGDDVIIPFRDITVTHDTTAVDHARTLRSEAAIDMSAGSLAIGNSGTFTSSLIDALVTVRDQGTLTFANDSVGGTGTLRNFGTLNLGQPGSQAAGSDGVVDVAVDNEAGVLTAFGVINNDAARPFVNGPGATLRAALNNPQETDLQIATGFTNEGRIEIASFNDTLMVRQGTLVNAPGATIAFLDGGLIRADLDNQGTVTVASPGNANAGTILGAVTNEGTMTVGQGFTLAVGGGPFEQNGMVSGPGTLRLANTTTEFGLTAVTAVAHLAVIQSTLTSATPLANLVLLQDGSTVNAAVLNQGMLTVTTSGFSDASPLNTINGSLTNVAGATLDITQATLAVTQGITNNGSIVLAADSFSGSNSAALSVTGGMLTNAPGATITLDVGPDDPGVDLLSAALDNQGLLTVSSEAVFTGSITNNGTLHVQGAHTGPFNVLLPPADLAVMQAGASAPLTNSGTISIDSLSSLTIQGGDLTNAGAVTVGSFGIVGVAGNYTQTDGLTVLGGGILTAGGLVDLEGGLLTGTGVINANVFDNAELEVGQPGAPGTLIIVGDYTQTAGGVLVIEIGGRNAGTDFDQLNITGQANLDGTLTVNLINGFQPASGDSLMILTFGSGTGAFATLNGDGPLFTPTFDPADVNLVAN
jgi:hypothetical protein